MRRSRAAQAFLDRVSGQLEQAHESVRHAVRWGWAPGSSTVRQFFRHAEPWEGLRFWFNTPSEYSFNPRQPFDAHLPIWKKPPAVKWKGTRPVEELLHDACRRLEQEELPGPYTPGEEP